MPGATDQWLQVWSYLPYREEVYPPVKNDDNKFIDHFYMHAQHRAQNLRAEEMVPCVLSCMRGGGDPVRA